MLIDYASWAESHNISFSAFEQHHISLETIRAIAAECAIEFRRGDILFIRTGLTREFEGMSLLDKHALNARKPLHAGVEATRDVLRWLWDTKFSAVAGDGLSWESYPSKTPDIFMHEWLLAGWGMPIGMYHVFPPVCGVRHSSRYFGIARAASWFGIEWTMLLTWLDCVKGSCSISNVFLACAKS